MGLNREEVLEAVRAEAARVLDVDPSRIVERARLADLGGDSLDLVEIVVPMEEVFGVDAGQAGLDGIVTVGDLLDHLLAGT